MKDRDQVSGAGRSLESAEITERPRTFPSQRTFMMLIDFTVGCGVVWVVMMVMAMMMRRMMVMRMSSDLRRILNSCTLIEHGRSLLSLSRPGHPIGPRCRTAIRSRVRAAVRGSIEQSVLLQLLGSASEALRPAA